MTTEQEQLDALRALMESDHEFTMTFGASVYFHIIAALQLALRHPDFDGPVRETVTSICIYARNDFAEISPALGDLIDRGFGAEEDE